jgi:hypothetical protein
MPKATRYPQIAAPEGRAISLVKSRFAALPQEPEDATLTGVTRSLNRRLLALNVSGSLRMGTLLLEAKLPEPETRPSLRRGFLLCAARRGSPLGLSASFKSRFLPCAAE